MTTQQSQQSYDAALKQDLGELIDAVELPELNKRYLRSRWLDQMLWAEGRANSARDRHFTLRVIAIIGGVIVPAMVGLNIEGDFKRIVGWTTLAISTTVAIALALESFFRWGERWTHYRRLSELLKSEGWLFLQLAGPYQEAGTHAKAYPEFTKRIEALLSSDVDLFITKVARDNSKQDDGAGGGKS